MSCCRLETERLLLRPPEAGDIGAMVALANDFDVTKNTSRMPYPYTDSDAQSFIARAEVSRAQGTDFTFAVTCKSDGTFLGGCGLHLREGGLFELGYWLGRPYWSCGYATETARKLASFAFRDLKAFKITAGYFHDNPASGRVLEKVGFKSDGVENHDCLARGHAVYCHMMVLDRENFGRRPERKTSR